MHATARVIGVRHPPAASQFFAHRAPLRLDARSEGLALPGGSLSHRCYPLAQSGGVVRHTNANASSLVLVPTVPAADFATSKLRCGTA